MSVTGTMYNKLFTKILDSSIWLESASTRLVWLTMIAAMDEGGFVQFAGILNLAHRARVSQEEAQSAVTCLESTDLNSSDPENEGRRIERVPGGWMILNAGKYREMVTRAIIREKTRVRVANFRAGKSCNDDVTPCNTPKRDVTKRKRSVTPSDTDTDSKSATDTKASVAALPLPAGIDNPEFREAWSKFVEHRKQIRKPLTGMAAEMQIRALAEMGTDRAVAAIHHSIKSGWQGIFEPQSSGKTTKPNGQYPEDIAMPE